MLDQTIKQQLKQYLSNLRQDVQLVVSLDESKASQEILALATEIADLSELVSVVRDDDASDRKPIMTVTNPEKNSLLRFAGIPMGHEFTSLVLALLHSGGHPMKLEPETIEQIANLDKNLDVEIFISPIVPKLP